MQRGKIKEGWLRGLPHEDSKCEFTIIGEPVMVNGMSWTPIVFDDEEDPTFFKTAGVKSVRENEAVIPDGSPTKESVFAEMAKDLTRKEDREEYPDSVFWLDKDGKFMFEHDEKNGIFWCSYLRVWSVFESKFGMKYDEIKAFMKGMVEQHFKWSNISNGSNNKCTYISGIQATFGNELDS